MVNVNVMETRDKADRFAKKHRLPYETVLDEKGDVSGIYGVRGIPTLILIDKTGRIVCRECRIIEGHLDRLVLQR